MALPPSFTCPTIYFRECLQFLKSYSWIYQFSNTCFVKDGVLDQLPADWVEYFTTVDNNELNSFPSINPSMISTESLCNFLTQVAKLSPPSQSCEINANLSYDSKIKLRKINPKKQHEILILSRLIDVTCTKDDILIDVGSGLGYLSELLYLSNRGFRILGLEADEHRVATSQRRHEQNVPLITSATKYRQHFITESSGEFILEEVEQLVGVNNSRLALIGLHACADLTITSMKLFFKLPSVRRLIIMPCCYHKLKIHSNGERSQFINFPLSRALKEAVANEEPYTDQFLNRPFLRLACQETSARWKTCTESNHQRHGEDMFLRGVVESILNDNEMVVKLKSKRTLNPNDDHTTFVDMCTQYRVHSKDTKCHQPWTKSHESRFSELLQKFPHGPKLAEGLTCLQATIQKLCENIVLYDRLCYMNETSTELRCDISVRFQKLMNDCLSPRCYVLIAEKL